MRKKQYSNDEALQALMLGREEGLDHFFHLYYAPLTYFAFKLLGDQYQAEEIAAEAFIKLWNNKEKFTAEGSIKSWLYTSVRNAAVDHLRKVKRLRITESGLQTVAYNEQSVLHHMIETETIQNIIKTLELLPPGCRQVFKMFYFGGKSFEEIARELNLSPHTVRNQKARAVRMLKAKLTPLVLLLTATSSVLKMLQSL